MNTHTVEVPIPDGVRAEGEGAHTFVYTVAEADAAGAVALLDTIRAEIDAEASVERSYSSGPLTISYRAGRDGENDRARVVVKLPNADAGAPEPTDDEALLRKAAANA